MADAMLTAVAEQIASLLVEQARYHVNLVRGAEEQVCSLAREVRTIRIVLDDAENRRFKEETVNLWLSRLEHASFLLEDVLDEWNYALLKLKLEEDDVVSPPKHKVCSFNTSSSCLCFKKAVALHDISKKILNVKAQLDDILQDKGHYKFVVSQPATSVDPLPQPSRIQTTSFIDLERVHGRDTEREFLVSKVLDESVSGGESSSITILAIVGAGGLGKTTLAQQVYNDTRVEKWFGKLRIWVCVLDPFDPAVVARGILDNIYGSSPNTNQLHVLLKYVIESLAGKRFLLVLDGVWTETYQNWEPFVNSFKSCGGAGSKILVTTRNERVAKMMGTRDSEICKPGVLSNEDCWSLLCRVALSERNENEFKEISMKIVQKCKGLPLAVMTFGSLLRFKKNLHEWENVLKSEIWEMKEAEEELFPHLLLSYKELSPPILKRCFSYCAIFPKEFNINVESLIRDWMALGYLGSDDKCEMEIEGRNYFDALAMRSLFQDFEKDDTDVVRSCKMHDIIHDFAQFLRKKGRVEAAPEVKYKAICRVCDPVLVSKVNEFCSLECKGEFPSNICDCLLRLRVLRLAKQCIPQGMVKLIHLRSLKLFSIHNMSPGDLKNIFQLHHLQTLIFWDCNLDMIPKEIKNVIHLRHLRLSENKSLKKLPKEIGELINLTELELSENRSLKELPKEIGNLIGLRRLILRGCKSLKELPESIGGFGELLVLDVWGCKRLCKLPEGLGQITSLRFLEEFKGGSGGSKLGLLKKLNNLGGNLHLSIRVGKDDGLEGGIIDDAGEADLRSKTQLKSVVIEFEDLLSDDCSNSSTKNIDSVRMGILDALHPHPNLQHLNISFYKGSKVPMGWMASPLNRLKSLVLAEFPKLKALPPLGRLPCLEALVVWGMDAFERLGRDFMGMGGEDEMRLNTNTNLPAFPKLKELAFGGCPKWEEWEDIRAAEEVSCMPSLTHLMISSCPTLTALPHHLLSNASSLHTIGIDDSPQLAQHYRDKEGTHWKSISLQNPNLHLQINA